MNRVAFGGSFNPPTIAHYEIIKKLSSMFDEVIIVPNGRGYILKELNEVDLRLEMLKLIKDDFSNVVISELELNRKFIGSVATLRDLNHPVFACGDDCLFDFKTWVDPINLLEENRFLIFTRNLNIDIIKTMIENDEFLTNYKDHFTIINIPFPNVSSSNFRKTLNYELLPTKIATFIKNNHLYNEKEES